MRKIADIHVFEDREFLLCVRRRAAFVMLFGAASAFLWSLLVEILRSECDLPLRPFELGVALGPLGDLLMGATGAPSTFRVSWWVSLAIALVAAVVVHELVHGYFFRQFAPPGAQVRFGANWEVGMVYASAEGVLYTRDQYLAIILAPTFVVTLLLLGVGIGLKWPMWTFIVTFTHLSSCMGDWGYALAIWGDPTITHCEDTAWGVAFYGEGGSSRQDRGAAVPGPGPRGDRAASRGLSVVDGGRDS